MIIAQPLELLEQTKAFDFFINVKGGGASGQAGAIRLGIANALVQFDSDYKSPLRQAGYITRDSRIVERKKVVSTNPANVRNTQNANQSFVCGFWYGTATMKYSTNEFKSGLKVLLDSDPCAILENEFVKPGKGQAFNRVKLRNLKTGRVLEKTFKSGETIDGADVIEATMQYLYNDGDTWHFMAEDGSFEQYAVSEAVLGEAKLWLKPEDPYTITLFNGDPIQVEAPNFVTLQVTDTDPGIRGDTATGGSKPATLETDAVVKVPLFVEIGDRVKIDTRTKQYIGRASD